MKTGRVGPHRGENHMKTYKDRSEDSGLKDRSDAVISSHQNLEEARN